MVQSWSGSLLVDSQRLKAGVRLDVHLPLLEFDSQTPLLNIITKGTNHGLEVHPLHIVTFPRPFYGTVSRLSSMSLASGLP